MNSAEYDRMYAVEDAHWWYVSLHQLIVGCIRSESERLGRQLRIFDAGCGTGRLCQLLADFGSIEGCDFSEAAVSRCRSRITGGISRADLNSIALDEGSYDVITSADVLCQTGIRDDVEVLKMFHRGLNPDGMLVVNLPAFEFLRSTHDAAVHVRERYTRNTLADRLRQAGFKVEFITYRVMFLFPVIAVYRMVFRRLGKGYGNPETAESDVKLPDPVVNAALKQVMRFENNLLKKHALPWGSSVFAIARKS